MNIKDFNQMSERKLFWANIASMIAIFILFVTAVYLSLSFYTHHGNTVVVPNVIGKDYEEAKDLLHKAGLRVTVADTGYVTSLAPNLILDQRIPAGSTVKYNRPVLLTINADHPQRKALPEIVDGSARSADIMLKSMGFTIGKRKMVPGDEDLVMAVEVNGERIEAGHRVSVEDPIVLIVGNGKVTEHYNGNDSIAWALELEIQETEAKKEQAKQALKDKLKAERDAENAGNGEGESGNTGGQESQVQSVQTSVPVEKVGTLKKSSDLFK